MQPTDDDMKWTAAALDRALNELIKADGMELDVALAAMHAQLSAIIAARHGGPTAARLFLDAARQIADMPTLRRAGLAQMPVQGRA